MRSATPRWSSLLARRTAALGRRRRPRRSRCPATTTPRAPGRRSSARAAASARSCTTARCATTPSCVALRRRRRRPRDRERAAAGAAAGPRGGAADVARRGSSRPARPSAGGWSATCTTAPSSASSPSRYAAARPGASCATTRRRRAAARPVRSEELALALEELRELARGIHPAMLSDRGLAAALEALAGRSPVPVELAPAPRERLPAPVEAAAYFVVAEALTNVAKYADASQARVRVARGATAMRSWRSPTTASAGPTRAAGRACAGSPIGSPRSTGGWKSSSPQARVPCFVLRSPYERADPRRDRRGLRAAARGPGAPAGGVGLRGRRPGGRRRGPAAQGRRAQARRRGDRRPDAADATPTRACAPRTDPRRAPGHRRARALRSTSRRPTRSTCFAVDREHRLPAQGPRRRRGHVHGRRAPGRRRRLGARPRGRRAAARPPPPRGPARSRSPRASARCSG